MSNEGLELFRLSGFDERQMGVLLAIAARGQGSTVGAILASLRASEQDGSSLARNVLATYAQAVGVLNKMAAGLKAKTGGG
jgi:hypothetical protein